MSKRGRNWAKFAADVRNHVDNYTVPQFGDAPHDNIEKWTAADCVRQIGKYVARFGTNQRGKEDQLLDMLKIAHYASVAHEKMKAELQAEVQA
jgi:hypothetical protein